MHQLHHHPKASTTLLSKPPPTLLLNSAVGFAQLYIHRRVSCTGLYDVPIQDVVAFDQVFKNSKAPPLIGDENCPQPILHPNFSQIAMGLESVIGGEGAIQTMRAGYEFLVHVHPTTALMQ